ncbi:MAG: hypothetical protein ABSA45_03740 [Verrucomicrobiota bacterium]
MNARNSDLKIVIAHEDLMTGIEAAVMLGRMGAQLEAEFEMKGETWWFDSGFWQFEALRDPELLEQAAAEAAAADIIIISVGGAELPACVRNWIECALPMKEGGSPALLALLDRGNDASGAPPRSESYLRRLAGRCGLDFVYNNGDRLPGVESGVESILSRSEGGLETWRS